MLKEVDIDAHEDEEIFCGVGNDFVEAGDKQGVGLYCLVEFPLYETDYGHEGAQTYCVYGVVVRDV